MTALNDISLKILRYHCLDRKHCSLQYHQLMDGIIERFQASYPAVRLDSKVMRNWYQLMYTLEKSLPTPDTPDVFYTSGGGILQELAAKGLVYDLHQELNDGWRGSFFPATLQPLTYNGHEYAIPLEQGIILVWYNKLIFERFGISVPANFNEFFDLCKELIGRGIVPLTMGTTEKWFADFLFSYLFHRIGGEDVFVADLTKAANSAEIRESFIGAAEKFLELARIGAFPPGYDTMDYKQLRMMFLQEKTAMWINGNRLLDYILEEGPQVLDHLGVFPFPAVSGGRGKITTFFGGSLATYAIAEKSANKESAVLFLKSFTDKRAALDVLHEMGDLPAVNLVPYEEYPSPIQAMIAREMEKAENILVHYFKYMEPYPAGIYLNSISKLIAKDITAREALQNVEDALGKQEMNSVNTMRGVNDEV
jgi:raffinose/stachyose/melibiose transport system substrate-binding protein